MESAKFQSWIAIEGFCTWCLVNDAITVTDVLSSPEPSLESDDGSEDGTPAIWSCC